MLFTCLRWEKMLAISYRSPPPDVLEKFAAFSLQQQMLPIISTRTRSISKMMKPPHVPKNDLPANQSCNELGRLMAVVAHSEVLGDSDGRAGGSVQYAKCYGQLLAVPTQKHLLLLFLDVMEHTGRIRNVALLLHPSP